MFDMNEMVVELVKLENGDIVLRKRDEKDKSPLLTMRFSDEAQMVLAGNELDVAQIMVHAGIQGAEQLQHEAAAKHGSPESNFLH